MAWFACLPRRTQENGVMAAAIPPPALPPRPFSPPPPPLNHPPQPDAEVGDRVEVGLAQTTFPVAHSVECLRATARLIGRTARVTSGKPDTSPARRAG
jgi:hypothetical protein